MKQNPQNAVWAVGTPAGRQKSQNLEKRAFSLPYVSHNMHYTKIHILKIRTFPSVPGRTWHAESYYFAQKLAEGMQNAGARLRGRGGIRYIYYLENDQKQLVESTHTEVRAERSFTLLEDVNCPVVLAEQCFVTNADDVERFGSEQGCKRTARIYYEAICAYFGTTPLPDANQ